jgi:hypothetical protein
MLYASIGTKCFICGFARPPTGRHELLDNKNEDLIPEFLLLDNLDSESLISLLYRFMEFVVMTYSSLSEITKKI